MANIKLSEKGKAFLKRSSDAAKVAEYLVKEGGKHLRGERLVIAGSNGVIKVHRSNSNTAGSNK